MWEEKVFSQAGFDISYGTYVEVAEAYGNNTAYMKPMQGNVVDKSTWGPNPSPYQNANKEPLFTLTDLETVIVINALINLNVYLSGLYNMMLVAVGQADRPLCAQITVALILELVQASLTAKASYKGYQNFTYKATSYDTVVDICNGVASGSKEHFDKHEEVGSYARINFKYLVNGTEGQGLLTKGLKHIVVEISRLRTEVIEEPEAPHTARIETINTALSDLVRTHFYVTPEKIPPPKAAGEVMLAEFLRKLAPSSVQHVVKRGKAHATLGHSGKLSALSGPSHASSKGTKSSTLATGSTLTLVDSNVTGKKKGATGKSSFTGGMNIYLECMCVC